MFQKPNMQMFFIAFPVLVLYFTAGGVQCGRVIDTAPVNNTHNCQDSETECLFGCCPVSNGVCCLDGKHCCEQGTICNSFAGKCVGLVADSDFVSLRSVKAKSLRSSFLKCLPGWTECAADRCCSYNQAVCCDDGEHCCPNGFTCDVPNNKCIPQYSTTSFEKPIERMSEKSSYKTCPGGRRMCPGYMSCCLKDNGDWDCCPNPHLPKFQYGCGQCCDTIFGKHTCCPNDYPVCSTFGCAKSNAPINKCIPDPMVTISENHSKKSCPGGLRTCPDQLRCCINDKGNWDCCPNPPPKPENQNAAPYNHLLYSPIILTPSVNLGTKFLLYTAKDAKVAQVLYPTPQSLSSSTLDPKHETIILIHGYAEPIGFSDIFNKVKDAIMTRNPMNVIIVDWTKANQPPYQQAVANARAVAADVAILINYHVQHMSLNKKTVHIIGHGLGAHLSGFVGKSVHGLPRITGLDPAGELFYDVMPDSRLSPTDADFVDVIHTNGGDNPSEGWGLDNPIGHLDFYPNNGIHQPGCATLASQCTGDEHNNANPFIASKCSHNRAIELFLDSINTCEFIAFQCQNYQKFLEGKCTAETAYTAIMGYDSAKLSVQTAGTRFYLKTNAQSPFCITN